MARADEFFVHLRVGPGAATLAVVGDKVGVAWCSPTEQFSRKVGRAIALGRIKAGGRFVFNLTPRWEGDTRSLRDHVVDVWLNNPVSIQSWSKHRAVIDDGKE